MYLTPNQLSSSWRIGLAMLVGGVLAAGLGFAVYQLAIAPILATPEATESASEAVSSSSNQLAATNTVETLSREEKLQLLAELRSTSSATGSAAVSSAATAGSDTVPTPEEEAVKAEQFSQLRASESGAEDTASDSDEAQAKLDLLSKLRGE